MSTPSGERPPLRIGTSEREAAYAALNAHLDAGRLDAEEYGERYGRASVARTRPDLEVLFADLPAPHPHWDDATPSPSSPANPSWATRRPRERRSRPPLGGWRLVPAVFLLVPVAALIVAATTGFWFLFFLIPLTASFVGRRFGRGFGHRGYGRRGSCGWVR